MGSRGPTSPAQMRATRDAAALPEAVGWELARIEGTLRQLADPKARQQLADVGEAAALRVLRMVGESPTPVNNFSAYIMWTARRAPDAPSAQSAAAWSSGPSRGDDSVHGPMHDDDIQMDDEVTNTQMAFNPSNHAMIEAVESSARQLPYGLHGRESPAGAAACFTPNPVGMEVEENPFGWINSAPMAVDSHLPETAHAMQPAGSPGFGMVSGLRDQAGFDSPVRQTIPTSRRMDSTPTPVRQITRHLHQMGCPSGNAMPVEPLVTANTSRATASPQMLALGELEFVRIFLIYVYLAGKKIEDVSVLHEDYIRFLNSLPMDRFESEIWNKFGHEFIAESDRRKNLDWDPNKTRVYHCNIEQRGNSTITIFKGPYIENATTRLHKVVGEDNVLAVKFSDVSVHANATDNFGNLCQVYHHLFEDGIMLGLRCYRFFIFKDSGKADKIKEERKERNKRCTSSVRCYFVCTESGWGRGVPQFLSDRTIGDARKIFMHIHTVPSVAKYLARFSLILSKTITLLNAEDLSTVKVVTIDDVPCEDKNGRIVLKHGEVLIHTDGTGLISEDLAKRCPTGVFKGNFSRTYEDTVGSKEDQFGIDDHPLLMQIRLFYNGLAVKGTLLVVRKLPKRTIHIRPSMIKVNSDPNLLGGHSFNSLELVSTGNRPKRAVTSRFLITLLTMEGFQRIILLTF
ncbi:hypothetical protein QYE76_037741 [Lolium multiflorum]|uniref:RNA-dependent RNA polymerase n=1 Tax=Lolium multiflorum TaxID=4521 RepID=A0AAD8QKF5_LOLMU|nr:hypothetical protein QYE76_037741 [Lolium multiflorum]